MVEARLTAGLLQRPIRRLLPRLAGLLEPVPGLGRPALPRPALRRRLRVVAREPLLGAALNPVMAALGEHQVRVGILAVRAAAVEGERIGQPLPGAHLLGERARERTPPDRVQFARQGELDLAVEPPVGALVLVGRLPVGARVLLGPRRHMPALAVLQLVLVPLVAALALDVVALGRRRLPTGAGPIADFEVIDGHGVTAVSVLTHAVSHRETGIVRPSLSFWDLRSRLAVLVVERSTRLMLPSYAMEPQDELQQLLARQDALKQELTAKKKELQEAQRRQRDTLTRQIRRAQVRLSTADRKRRTRRLILIGSYIEHRTQADPTEYDQLMHGLNGFLERDQDRALFDLPANTETAAASADPLPGWRPHRLDNGDWGSRYLGDTSRLPAELVGTTITVQAKNGQSWTATVTAVVDRSRNQVLVTDSGRPASP